MLPQIPHFNFKKSENCQHLPLEGSESRLHIKKSFKIEYIRKKIFKNYCEMKSAENLTIHQTFGECTHIYIHTSTKNTMNLALIVTLNSTPESIPFLTEEIVTIKSSESCKSGIWQYLLHPPILIENILNELDPYFVIICSFLNMVKTFQFKTVEIGSMNSFKSCELHFW